MSDLFYALFRISQWSSVGKVLSPWLSFILDAVPCICVPFGVLGRMWNSIVSVPDYCLYIFLSYEPPHDKTNKMTCAPSEDSDKPGHPPSLVRVFSVRMKKVLFLSYPLSAQRRLGSDWADAQADLSLRWAHRHFLGFIMRRLICRPRRARTRASKAVGSKAIILKSNIANHSVTVAAHKQIVTLYADFCL